MIFHSFDFETVSHDEHVSYVSTYNLNLQNSLSIFNYSCNDYMDFEVFQFNIFNIYAFIRVEPLHGVNNLPPLRHIYWLNYSF